MANYDTNLDGEISEAEAAAVTGKSKAAIASIMTYGLYRVKSAKRRDDVEKAMEESMMEVCVLQTGIHAGCRGG